MKVNENTDLNMYACAFFMKLMFIFKFAMRYYSFRITLLLKLCFGTFKKK